MFIHGPLTERVLRAFFNAYNGVGFGYPENICRNALAVELELLGISFVREVPIEVIHRGVSIGTFRFDLIAEECLLIETKATKQLVEADRRQIQSYLKSSPCEIGLLLNFGPRPQHERFIYTNDRK